MEEILRTWSSKCLDLDYNLQGDGAQFDRCAIGINSNHLMRFDVNSGTIVHSKAYDRDPGFSCVATDARGTIVIGDRTGGVRVFADVGKRAVKAISGFGDPITEVHISSKGDVVATTDYYFFLLSDFLYSSERNVHLSKLPRELSEHSESKG